MSQNLHLYYECAAGYTQQWWPPQCFVCVVLHYCAQGCPPVNPGLCTNSACNCSEGQYLSIEVWILVSRSDAESLTGCQPSVWQLSEPVAAWFYWENQRYQWMKFNAWTPRSTPTGHLRHMDETRQTIFITALPLNFNYFPNTMWDASLLKYKCWRFRVEHKKKKIPLLS